MTRSFPSSVLGFSASPSAIQSRYASPSVSRSRPDAMFDHPQLGLSPLSPSTISNSTSSGTAGGRSFVAPNYPAPYIGDEDQVSQSPVYSYNHLDFSISTASEMSRCGTLGSTRLDSIPMSVEMERDVPRAGLGSYDSGKLAARADALRRLSGYTGSVPSGQESSSTLRRTVSFKKDSKKDKRITGDSRPRAYSLSAKMAREIGISSPVPMPMPVSTLKRETLSPSRGIYLGDLSIDLGGRYGDGSRSSTSPTSSGGSSLYPASSTSSYCPRQSIGPSRPLHPALSSEISLLATSSVGLGFSPVGTPVSLPESLRAEAIDLTGNYAPEPGRDITTSTTKMTRIPKRTSSLHYLKIGPPTLAPPLPDLPRLEPPVSSAEPAMEGEGNKNLPIIEKPPRRSFLLAQETFFIPPLVSPPSLRFSRSLSNLHFSQPSTPTTPIPPVPRAPDKSYSKRSHIRRGTGAFGICSPNGIDPLPLSPPDHTSPLSLSSITPSIRLERKRSSPFMDASASIRMMFNPIARSLSKSFDRETKANTSVETQQSSSATLKSKISGPVENDGERMWREGLLREALTASLGASLSQNSNSERPRSNPKSRLAIPRQFLETPVNNDQSHLEVEIDTSALSFADPENHHKGRERRESKAAVEIDGSEYPWATLQNSPIRRRNDEHGGK